MPPQSGLDGPPFHHRVSSAFGNRMSKVICDLSVVWKISEGQVVRILAETGWRVEERRQEEGVGLRVR